MINVDELLALKIPETRQIYTARDTILYALGVGLGHDPMDGDVLPFVYEKNLRALPTMAVVLANPGLWMRDIDTGIDYTKVVHGEQSLRIHRTIAPIGTVVGSTRVVDVVDKGHGRGALVMAERAVRDESTGDALATVGQTLFCRGDGGFGGPSRETTRTRVLPDREPDVVVDLSTRPESALIYRLSGDYNPLHVDPAVAIAAGFLAPIYHGLGTFGLVGHALLKGVCNYDPTRLISISGRFSAPVYPSESIRTEIWCDGGSVIFRALVAARAVVVLNNGLAEIRTTRNG
jgi:acyl dehydratase